MLDLVVNIQIVTRSELAVALVAAELLPGSVSPVGVEMIEEPGVEREQFHALQALMSLWLRVVLDVLVENIEIDERL